MTLIFILVYCWNKFTPCSPSYRIAYTPFSLSNGPRFNVTIRSKTTIHSCRLSVTQLMLASKKPFLPLLSSSWS